eukprot:g13713.t1
MGLCLFREGETDARIEKLGDYRKKFARVLFNEENLNQECSVFWIQMRAQQKGGFLEKADVLCCTQKFLDQIDAGEEATLAAIDRLVNIVFASEDLGNSLCRENPEKITFEVFKTYIREMMLLLDLEMTKRLQQALVDRETLCLAPGVDYEQVTLPYRPHYCYHARDRERESFSNDVWVEERTTDHAEAGDTSFAAASDSEARAIAEIRRLMGCILLVEEGKGDDQAAEEDYNDEEKQIQSDQQSQTAVLSLFQEIGSVSPVTVGVLRETKIGVFTQKYKTHASVEVQGLVRQLRQQWTEVVRRNASTHDTSASFGVTPRVGSSGELVPGGAVQRDAEPRRASSTTDAMKEKLTKTGVLLQVFHPEDSALEWTTLRVTRNSSTTPGGRPNQLQLSSGSSNMELNFDEIRSVEHSKDEPELILLTLKKDENNPLTLRFQDVQSAHVCCNSLRKFGLPVV